MAGTLVGRLAAQLGLDDSEFRSGVIRARQSMGDLDTSARRSEQTIRGAMRAAVSDVDRYAAANAKARAAQTLAAREVERVEARLRTAREGGNTAKIESAEARLEAARARQAAASISAREAEAGLTAAREEASRAADGTAESNDRVAESSDGVRGKMAEMVAGGVAVGATFAAITTVGMDYTRTMNTLQAVSGATADQMGQVSAKARELGNDVTLPGTSAVDAAAAMTELAKGGMSVDQAMAGAKGSLQLAAAAQIDAATAAGIQSAALQAFGKDASYAGHAADILSNTSNASSAEITDVAQALQQAGTVANGFGVNMADTATMIGLFANAGITGSDAGTLLKTGLQSLTDQSDSAQGAIEALGLTVYDNNGKFVGMRSLWEQLANASHNMSDEQFQANTNILFGSDAMRAAMVAANGGVDAYDKMSEAIGKQGTAAELANAKMKGLPGAWERVQNALESVALTAYGTSEGALTTLANTGADLIGVGDGLIGTLSAVTVPITALVQGFGALPGPMQTTIALLGVAKVASMLFGTQIGNVRGRLSNAASGLAGYASALRTSAQYAGQATAQTDAMQRAMMRSGQANGQVGALARSMMVLGAQGGAMGRIGQSFTTAASQAQRFGNLAGGAAAGMTTMRIGASGLMGALGGPFGLAITGAIGALSLWMSKKREDAQASQEAAARTNSYADALKESGGVITSNIREMIANDDAYESARDSADKLKISQRELSDAMVNEGGSAKNLTAELDKVIAAHTKTFTETNQQQGTTTPKTRMDDTAKAATRMRDAIMQSNKELDDGKTKAQRTAEAIGDITVSADHTQQAVGPMSKAMTDFAESTDGAASNADKLTKALDALNGDSLTKEDALQQWSDGMRDFAKSLGEGGAAAIQLNGHVDVTTEKGSALQDSVQKQSSAFNQLATSALSSGDSIDSIRKQLQGSRQAFVDQVTAVTGNRVAAEHLADTYGLIPDQVVTRLDVQGVPQAIAALDAIGVKATNLPTGKFSVVDNTPEVRAKLDSLKVQYTTLPDGRLVIKDNTPETIQKLNAVGIATTGLPGGFVKINDTTPENLKKLQAVGIATTTLPDGSVVVNVTDNDKVKNIRASLDAIPPIKYLTFDVKTTGEQTAYGQRVVEAFKKQNNAEGSIRTYANGGFDGPLPDRALIQKGQGNGLVQWAEGETDVESFIPWAPQKRDRSTSILRETARAFGYALMPSAALAGQSFADGGVRAPAFNRDAAVSTAKAHNGEPYVYGQLDCSGFLSEVWRNGTGQSGRFTTDSDFASLGWVKGDDPNGFTVGTNGGSGENGHMAGRLYGVPIESASDGIKYGGSAQDPNNFPMLWHWPAATQAAGEQSTAPAQPAVRTIPLVQNPDGTWTSTDPAWAALIKRESGGDMKVVQKITDANSGGNEASGGFQIAKQTWAANGGLEFAPTAGEADPEKQAIVAARIFDKSGGSPWGAGLAGREDKAGLRAGITTMSAPDPTAAAADGGSGAVQNVFVTNMPSSFGGSSSSDAPSNSSGASTSTTATKGSVSKSQAKVTSATTAVDTAKRRQADAAGRLHVAETRLTEVRNNSKARASQLQAAEEAVAKAKRDSGAATAKVAVAERTLEAARRGAASAGAATTTANLKPSGPLPLVAYAQGGIEDRAPSKATLLNRERMWITRAGEAGPELYLPMDNSPRSKALWMESGRRMGLLQSFAEGGFGGYSDDTRDYMAPTSLSDYLALGVGGAFTAASAIAPYVNMATSKQIDLGNVSPTMDTSANSVDGVAQAVGQFADSVQKQIEELSKAVREQHKQIQPVAVTNLPKQSALGDGVGLHMTAAGV